MYETCILSRNENQNFVICYIENSCDDLLKYDLHKFPVDVPITITLHCKS
jgi:hypothetical protein